MFRIILSITLLAGFNAGFSQSHQPILPFDEAVSIALEQNVNLNQQKNQIYTAQAQKYQSMASFLPTVRLEGYAQRSDGQQPNPDGGELQDLSINNIGAQVNANLVIFNGLGRIHTYAQSRHTLMAQQALVERTAQDVILNVTNQYLQVLLDQELLRIADENYRTQLIIMDRIKKQVELGSRARAEEFTQDAEVKNREQEVLLATISLNNDKAILAQILQLDPADSFQVAFPSMARPEMNLTNLSMDSLYNIGFSNRQDIKQLEHQVEANQAGMRSNTRGYYPSVNVFARYGSQYNSVLSPDPSYGNFQNQFSKVFPTLSYGVSVSIPIFGQLQNRSMRVASRVDYENSEQELENLKKSVKIDIQRAFNNYQAAIRAYKSSQAQFAAGELALETQQESYTLGVADQVAVARASQIYVQGASSRVQAEVVLAFQQIMLEYALGTLSLGDLQY